MLDNYIHGDIREITVNGKQYQIKYFQGSHSNEYLLCEISNGTNEGYCQLFDRGILSLSWIVQDGQRVHGITEYSNGKALQKQNWGSILGTDDIRLIKNTPHRLTMTVQGKEKSKEKTTNVQNRGGLFGNNNQNPNPKNTHGGSGSMFGGSGGTPNATEQYLYRGEFDNEMNRHGYGMEYDRDTGKEKIMGYWEKDKLVRIIREFNADKKEMIEYRENSNLDLLHRVPVYIGGYCFLNGSCLRNGKGYLIDEESGVAIREGNWLNGKEQLGTDLYDGWYVKGMKESIRFILKSLTATRPNNGKNDELQITVKDDKELKELNHNVSRLIVAPNSCNQMKKAEFVDFQCLESIEIGDGCFESVKTFRIDGLNTLQTLKIGNYNAFAITKRKCTLSLEDTYKSFHILNCEELKSIEIGNYSFGVFGGEFELKNLPQLQSLRIGIGGNCAQSYNFYLSSFIIRGIRVDSKDNFFRSTKS